MITRLVYAGCLAFLLSLEWGCAGLTPGEYQDFWDQRVAITAWGFTMATMYGPFNIGYLNWQRNLEKPGPVSQPGEVIPLVPKATIP